MDHLGDEAGREAFARGADEFGQIALAAWMLTPNAVVVTDAAGTIRHANPSASKVFGYGHTELIGMNVRQLMPGPERGRHDDHMRRFAETGVSHAPVGGPFKVRGLRKDGEVIHLDRSIQRMMIGSDWYYIADLKDVTGDVRAHESLATLADQLRDEKERVLAADRSKSIFIANMSHELRTPLNAIIGFADFMRSEIAGPIENPLYKDYLQDIFSSAHHLLELINDILDMSKVVAGKWVLHKEPFHLDEVVRGCVRMVRGHAIDGDIDLRAVLPDDPVAFHGDRRAIKQAVLNLLSNAIKFTPRDGTVTVTVSTTADGVAVRVADTGRGIPPHALETLGTPFTQVTTAPEEHRRGTGLGLALTKSFIHLHGGEVRIHSQVGVGTEVDLLLPHEPADTEELVGAE